MSVHPSVRMEQLGSQWTDFHEIWYLCIFRQSAEKVQISLKSEENYGYFTWRSMYVYDVFLSILLRMTMFQTKVVKEINTHFISQNFLFENCSVYEVMWKNTVGPGRPQMTRCSIRIACWIPKDTNILSEYAILTAFPLLQWLHQRALMLHYTHIACLRWMLHLFVASSNP